MMGEGSVFREKGIYRLAGAGILAGAVLFCGERFLGIGRMDIFLAIEAAAILGLLFGINFLPLRGKFFCLWTAVLGMGAAVWAAGAEEAFLFLRSYFSWLAGTGVYGEWARAYAFLQTAVITVFCYLIQIGFEKIRSLKLIFTVLLLAGILTALLSGWQVSHLGMVFGVCFCVTVYAEQAEKHWEKVKSGNRRAYMLRVMPFLAVYLLLMVCMPAPEEPYDWPWVKSVYRQLRETFLVFTRKIKWGGREGFGMSFSGFSEAGELGGDLQETAEAVMTVEPLNIMPLNLYLSGTVYDTFDGRQWLQTWHGDPAGAFLDAAETFCAARAYGGQFQRDYLRRVELKIRYQDFNTGYMFAPLKTWEISGEGGGPAYTCEGGSLRLEQSQGYGTAYELEYYQMNAGQEAFYRFLEVCSEEKAGRTSAAENLPKEWLSDEVILAEVRKKYGKEGEYTVEDVGVHRQEIYENYLDAPVLSDETADYLARITAGAETDVEKLRAIERKLSSLTYTLTPGELPEWVRDESTFLDFFLLESGEGYCTYFATAFVLLARTEGIPARYVQGYYVQVEDAGETAVYSNMAHAWPEVYLPGVGWIPFEPTPGYGEMRYTSWKMKQSDAMTEAVSMEKPETVREEAEGAAESAEEPEQTQDASEIGIEEKGRLGSVLKWAGYVFPVTLGGYILLVLLENAWGRHRLEQMCPEDIFRLEAGRNLKLLALLGLERGEWETLQELAERCRRQADIKETEDSGRLHFIGDYEDVVYGGRSADEEMIRNAVEERQELLKSLKREKRWAYVRWQLRAYLVRYR